MKQNQQIKRKKSDEEQGSKKKKREWYLPAGKGRVTYRERFFFVADEK